eukprot:scaffold58769_cov44-Phaeocystis_antarctica.AAC.1
MLLSLAPLTSVTCAPAARFRAPAICSIHTVSGSPPASKVSPRPGAEPANDTAEAHLCRPPRSDKPLRIPAPSSTVSGCTRPAASASHQGWRGDGVVDRVDSAIDQSGGRELAAGIERIYEARHGRRCEGAADVAGDLVR